MRLRISTHPISISLSPVAGSRPVVSVSITISRSMNVPKRSTRVQAFALTLSPRLCPPLAVAVILALGGGSGRAPLGPICGVCGPLSPSQRCDDSIDLRLALFVRSGGVHNEIGARTFVRIAQLPCQDLGELVRRHAGALHDAHALDVRRC